MSKVVLITGASSGMGKVTARLLAKDGYTVYGAARSLDKMKDIERDGVQILSMDVTDDTAMLKAVQTIIAKEGAIDVLINNAGFGEYGSIEDIPLDKARYQLEVNLFSTARLIQLVLPKMREKRWGRIINITSVGGKLATPYGGWYHASKFALEGLSDSLRNEVKQFGIDVVVIEPGAVKSDWGDIAMQTLKKNSETSPYKATVDKFVKGMQSQGKNGSKPKVIAKLIKKAIEAKQPKTRYVGGFMGKPTVFMKWLLPDRAFDKMLMSQMK